MLNYDLVTPKAAYKILKRRDLARFIELVFSFYAERGRAEDITRQKIERTADELFRDQGRGTVFVIEKERDLIGYAIIVNHWSNELGGNVLCVDEIFIEPAWRGRGIASDFVNLLCKVAPQRSAAVQVEVEGAARKAAGLWRGLGFTDAGTKVMIRPLV